MSYDLQGFVPLKESDLVKASRMTARAFFDSSFIVDAIPDESERSSKLPYLFEFMIRFGILYGVAYAFSPELEGIVVWLPYENIYMSFIQMIRCGGLRLIFKLGLKTVLKYMNLDEFINKRHKENIRFKHWYLLLISVDPECQSKGIGGQLLKPMLEIFDRENVPCYLETQNERNVAFYERHSFEIIDKYSYSSWATNHSEVNLWCMLRKSFDG